MEPQDIAINLNLGQEQLRKGPLGWLGFVDRKAMRRSSEKELDRLGVRTAPMTRPVEMLSGGQRQVVALARSAIRVNGESQGILLLDEPTAALGYEQTKNVEGLIRRMADQGIAIVVVTHDLPLCYEVADRIVILNRGKKVADLPVAGADRDHVVGWITGSRASMFESDGLHERAPVVRRALPAARRHRVLRAADERPGAGGAVPRVHAVARRGPAARRGRRGHHGRGSARAGAGAGLPARRRRTRPARRWSGCTAAPS